MLSKLPCISIFKKLIMVYTQLPRALKALQPKVHRDQYWSQDPVTRPTLPKSPKGPSGQSGHASHDKHASKLWT